MGPYKQKVRTALVNSPGGHVRTQHFDQRGPRFIQSLVGELGSRKPFGAAK